MKIIAKYINKLAFKIAYFLTNLGYVKGSNVVNLISNILRPILIYHAALIMDNAITFCHKYSGTYLKAFLLAKRS